MNGRAFVEVARELAQNPIEWGRAFRRFLHAIESSVWSMTSKMFLRCISCGGITA